MKGTSTVVFWLALALIVWSGEAAGQTTAFTYQGQLQSSSALAVGNYDFEFLLFDALSGGSQIGSTITQSGVQLANGVFTVTLDFGSNYPGAGRFLEIHVRTAGGGSFIPLSPRQPITSAPYSIKSLNTDTATNATQLGGMAANQYVQTSDTRLTNARDPLPGSLNYIQNGTSQQASSSFNISGNGTAGGTLSGSTVNAQTQYNLNGTRVIGSASTSLFVGQFAGTVSTGSFNTFTGTSNGSANTTGQANSFFGYHTGASNIDGSQNSFFGTAAGFKNDSGSNNSYFGASSGVFTSGSNNSFFGAGTGGSFATTGSNNSFFGQGAGRTGNGNSIFGQGAGTTNSGDSNSFFGRSAGKVNLSGTSNSFFGESAGFSNQSGNYNSFFGQSAGLSNTQGSANTYVGAFAGASNDSASQNAFFGANAGNESLAANNSFFGFGAGQHTTSGTTNAFFGTSTGLTNTNGSSNSLFGSGADVQGNNLTNATAIGANAAVGTNNALVLGGITGVNGGTSTNVGIGTTSPGTRLHVVGNSWLLGNVGVGVTNPQGKLEVAGDTNVQGKLAASSNTTSAVLMGAGSSGSEIKFYNLFSPYFSIYNNTNALTFADTTAVSGLGGGGTPYMAITNGGGVGVGTASPTGRLNIVGSNGQTQGVQIDNREIKFRGDGIAHYSIFANRISGTLTFEDTSSNQGMNTAGAVALAIKSGSANVGVGTTSPDSKLQVSGQMHADTVKIDSYVNGGNVQVCVNTSTNQIAVCNSSLRYKNDVRSFGHGLDIIERLRPVSFTWKHTGTADIGLVAEDVATVAPVLTFNGKEGEVEGVKYNDVSAVLVSAVKEQQAQIQAQSKLIQAQQIEIKELRHVICSQNKRIRLCGVKDR